MRKIVLLTSLILFFILVPKSTQATSVLPPQFTYNANPGDEIEEIIRMYDDAVFADGVDIYPAVFNFTQKPDKEGTIIIITDPEEIEDDVNWVDIQFKCVVVRLAT